MRVLRLRNWAVLTAVTLAVSAACGGESSSDLFGDGSGLGDEDAGVGSGTSGAGGMSSGGAGGVGAGGATGGGTSTGGGAGRQGGTGEGGMAGTAGEGGSASNGGTAGGAPDASSGGGQPDAGMGASTGGSATMDSGTDASMGTGGDSSAHPGPDAGGDSGSGGASADAGMGGDAGDAGPLVCTDNGDCRQQAYCSKSVGSCTSEGQCIRRPLACLKNYRPVCGCDGTTYSNACMAHQAGVNIQFARACEDGCPSDPPDAAGCCFDDADCGDGMRCVGESCTKPAVEAGTCKSQKVEKGTCWEDSDCDAGGVCSGVSICPCGAYCVKEDQPGKCLYVVPIQ